MTVRYIDRVEGAIVAHYEVPQHEGHEAIDDQDPEFIAAITPQVPTTEQQVSAAIDANLSLASLVDLIPELAANIPIETAPKIHAMAAQVAAIKAQVGGA